MIELPDFSMADLLPPALKSTKEDIAMAAAGTAILKRVFEEMSILDPFVIPEQLLDIVAVEEHVDFYDPDLSVEQKRELIANSFFFHQKKATSAAVEQLIEIVFGEGKVVEWFEYGAEPGYFKVVTSNPAVTNELAAQFIHALNSVKRHSAWLDVVEITQVEQMNLYFGSVLHTGDKMILRQVT
ncbi:phage tail protein I [Domibacillus aminovorans]|uniref:phage tail protein I n=1 Tax=Domibacillus aminovorans TaxID=29332 RepID=UPI003D24BFC2